MKFKNLLVGKVYLPAILIFSDQLQINFSKTNFNYSSFNQKPDILVLKYKMFVISSKSDSKFAHFSIK